MKRLKVILLALILAFICINALAVDCPELIEAAATGDYERVEKLIAKGCDIDFIGDSYFFKKNENIKEPVTALTEAATSGHIEIVKLLIDNDVDIKSNENVLALLFSARFDHIAIVKCLIEHGIDINSKHERYGATVLMAACATGNVELAKYLIGKGVDINEKNSQGETSIIYAARAGHANVIKELINKGADANSKDGVKRSALMLAARTEHIEAIRVLLNNGADINYQLKGATALSEAAGYGRIENVKLLLEKGAKVGFTPYIAGSHDSSLPLRRAEEEGYEDILKLLKAVRAKE